MCDPNSTKIKSFYFTMKLKLFFSMMALAAMVFTGCNKQTELEINYGKTATVIGKVELSKDNSDNTPATNTKVYAKIEYSELITGENPVGNKTFETTTDTEGRYTLEIPVIDEGTDVTIYTKTNITNDGYYEGAETSVRDLTPDQTEFAQDMVMSFTSFNEDDNTQIYK